MFRLQAETQKHAFDNGLIIHFIHPTMGRLNELSDYGDELGYDEMYEFLAEHIVEWNVGSEDEDDDEPLPIVRSTFNRIPIPYIRDMTQVLMGVGANGDPLSQKRNGSRKQATRGRR